MTFFLPPANKIIPFIQFGKHARNFGRIILQIGIHGDQHIPAHERKCRFQRRRFSAVAPKPEKINSGIFPTQPLQDFPGIVGAAVINKKNPEVMSTHMRFDTLRQSRQCRRFIVGRDYKGDPHDRLLPSFRHSHATGEDFRSFGDQAPNQLIRLLSSLSHMSQLRPNATFSGYVASLSCAVAAGPMSSCAACRLNSS
ncbi:MAG: hypothetical protein BWY07_01386 [Candidatus Hydrogenedentes bacterium ADurb.Bin170]|nr:MAG: hypothetical protein BWY07_01386 [Candidatus Hydrogenedentes bacterium ADurb.Bin170]